MTKARIVVTAILTRVMVGTINKNGMLSDKAVDRTDDFIIACADYLKAKGTQVLSINGKPKYELILKDLDKNPEEKLHDN